MVWKRFLDSVRKTYPTLNVDVSQYQLRTERGKDLPGTSSLLQSGVATGQDLFVAPSAPKQAVTAPKKLSPTKQDLQYVEKLKEEGNEQMKQGQYALACERYSEAISLDDSNAVLYGNRSQAHLSLSQWKEALEDAQRAVEIDGTFAKAYLRGGKAAMALSNHREAHSILVRGLRVADRKNDKLSQQMCRELRKMISDCETQMASLKDTDSSSSNPRSAALEESQKAQLIDQFQRSIEQMQTEFNNGKLRQAKEIAKGILEVVKEIGRAHV